jgi:hypothetical protein
MIKMRWYRWFRCSFVSSVSIWLCGLPALLLLFTCGEAMAQSGTQITWTTPEEERILHLRSKYLGSKLKSDGDAFLKEYERYIRNGCKSFIVGDWVIEEYADIINISYNDQTNVFVGKLTGPASIDYVPQGSIFFNVSIPKLPFSLSDTTEQLESLDEASLRRNISLTCKLLNYEGIEFYYNSGEERNVTHKIAISITSEKEQLIYKGEGNQEPYVLTRLKKR